MLPTVNFKVHAFCSCVLLPVRVQSLKISCKPLDEIVFIAIIATFSILDALLKRSPLKTSSQDTLLSHRAPVVTCAIFLLVMTSNTTQNLILVRYSSYAMSAFDEPERRPFTDTHCLKKSYTADVILPHQISHHMYMYVTVNRSPVFQSGSEVSTQLSKFFIVI